MKKAFMVFAVILFVLAIPLSVSAEANWWSGQLSCSGGWHHGHHFWGGHHSSGNPNPPLPPAKPADPKGDGTGGGKGK
jgi:hypothetical protein